MTSFFRNNVMFNGKKHLIMMLEICCKILVENSQLLQKLIKPYWIIFSWKTVFALMFALREITFWLFYVT